MEWPDSPGAPQPREGPHASLLQSPAMAAPITWWVRAGFMRPIYTCPRQAGLPILLRHHPPQPGLGEPSAASEEKAGGKGSPSKRKEVSPRQPSAIGDQEVTAAALSAAGGGRPCSPLSEVKLHAGTYNPWGRRSPLHPISHPTAHQGRERVLQSMGAAAPCEQSPTHRCGYR